MASPAAPQDVFIRGNKGMHDYSNNTLGYVWLMVASERASAVIEASTSRILRIIVKTSLQAHRRRDGRMWRKHIGSCAQHQIISNTCADKTAILIG
jgi:hypothetical protein